MTSPLPQDQLEDRRGRLLAGLAALVPEMQRRAPGLDRGAGFPETEIARLRDLGALAAPLPIPLGGLGMGTDPDGADALMEALRLIGRGNLSVGRLFEAHVNALRLVVRFGSPAVAREAEEELGLTARPGNGPLFLSVTPTRGPGRHTDVDLWFVLDLDRHTPLRPDEREFGQIRWLGLDEDFASGDYDPQMQRFARKLAAGQGR